MIWIAPVSELIKAEEEEAKAIAQSVKLAPLQTEYIQLSYAKAADIEKLITQGKIVAQVTALQVRIIMLIHWEIVLGVY